jgi:signal peptidase II
MPDCASPARRKRSSKKPRNLDEDICPQVCTAWSVGDDLVKKYAQAFPRRFLTITVLAILVDQFSKTLATCLLLPGESVLVLGDLFRLTLVLNPGGVFGTKLGSQNFYTFISLLAIGVTLWFFFKTKTKEKNFRTGLCLVLGGAVGNLIDRFRFGEVVDFLDFDFFNITLPPTKVLFFNFPGFYLDRWPVFNLADSFVLIGMVLIIIHLLFSKESPTADTSYMHE